MTWEQHGEHQVDREAIEELMAEQFAANLQAEVDGGKITQGEAIRIHASFMQSPAFRQAVDASIKHLVAGIAELDANGGRLH